MNWTNEHNIPGPVAKTIMEISTPRVYREQHISVTELIGPPMIRQLRRHYQDVITPDVSGSVYAVLGTAVHEAIAKHGGRADDSMPSPDFPGVELSEKRLFIELTVDGNVWELGGTLDRVSNGELLDFKCVSIFSFLLGAKEEWIAQTNLYRWIAFVNGLIPEETPMRIVAILRDWSYYQHERDPERVPPSPVYCFDVPHWTASEIQTYLSERFALHAAAELTEDANDVPVCTPSERWQDATKCAVYKGSNKRATKVCDSETDAYRYVAENKINPVRIEKREGKPKRCLSYCDFRDVCPYGKCLKLIEDNEDE